MDTSKTQFYKARDGWNAKDTIDMGQTVTDDFHGEGKRMLQLHTYKRSRGGIHTTAHCSVHRDGTLTMDLFGDYSKTVATLDGAKCTEKAVKTLHATVMAQQADAILAEARAFYAAKDAAKALNAKRDAELKAADEERARNFSRDGSDQHAASGWGEERRQRDSQEAGTAGIV